MSTAIAVWATPDGQTVTGTIRVGVVAYHETGILRVDFDVDGGTTTSVYAETQNPDHTDWAGRSEYEYVYTIDTTGLTNGARTVHATAYPVTGTQKALPDLALDVQNGTSFDTYYVATTGNDTTAVGSFADPFLTIEHACDECVSGDTIKVETGTYALPNGTHAFTKYVTITPDTGATVVIAGGGTLNCPFLKFLGIGFTVSSNTWIGNNNGVHHIWAKNCTAVGFGRAEPTNTSRWFNLSWRDTYDATATQYLVVENCTASDFDIAISLTHDNYPTWGTGNLHAIIRGCSIHHNTSDEINWGGYNLLVTGNQAYSNTFAGPGNHCDHISANIGGGNAIIRNNWFYDGYHQGMKFGGYQAVTKTAQGGGASSITLAADESSIDDYFIPWTITITSGPGVGESKTVTDYDGTSKVATVDSPWVQSPTSASTYNRKWVQPFSNFVALNNVFALNTGGSVNLRLEGNTKGRSFNHIVFEYNSVLDGTSTFVIEADVVATDCLVRNNIFWGASSEKGPIAGVTFANNHHSDGADPLFTSEAGWDLTLQAGSPCRDAGVASGYIYDQRGYLRDSSPDQGAYEYSNAGLLQHVMVKA